MLTWGKPNERYYEHGLDRGVLYIDGKSIPWNGLVSFDEGGEQGSATILYRDGIIYLADMDASDFSAQMTTIYFPRLFSKAIGIPEVADGFHVDNQKPQRFGLSYRSLVGSGGVDDQFGYQIHLVYNCMASVAPRQRRTLGSENAPVEFNFNIQCTPVVLPGFRPSAHYIIDTRRMTADKVSQLEDMIYGDGASVPGALPNVEDVFNLLNYGDAMVFTVHPNNTYTVEGAADNLEETSPGYFLMRNVNGVDNMDGTYTISDGGDTTVIIE